MKTSWSAPPTQLLLSRNDVHIWRASLSLSFASIQELKESLSLDERLKAEHFLFERDRSHFIAARGILRSMLASYLGVEPSAIRFCYENDGKPKLQSAFGKRDIKFNLSHSEALAIYVFTQGHEVGIDVEYMHEIPEMEQIVEQFFSVRERFFFGTLTASEKQERFFNWWTRKEALMKATGDGLSYPLDTFDVSAVPGKSFELLRTVDDAKEASKWTIGDVGPGEGFTGSFAVEGGNCEVQYWQWPGSSKDSPGRTISSTHFFQSNRIG